MKPILLDETVFDVLAFWASGGTYVAWDVVGDGGLAHDRLAVDLSDCGLGVRRRRCPSQTQETIKIGAPLALSGKFVSYGAAAKRGIEMAVDIYGGKVAEQENRSAFPRHAIRCAGCREFFHTTVVGREGELSRRADRDADGDGRAAGVAAHQGALGGSGCDHARCWRRRRARNR